MSALPFDVFIIFNFQKSGFILSSCPNDSIKPSLFNSLVRHIFEYRSVISFWELYNANSNYSSFLKTTSPGALYFPPPYSQSLVSATTPNMPWYGYSAFLDIFSITFRSVDVLKFLLRSLTVFSISNRQIISVLQCLVVWFLWLCLSSWFKRKTNYSLAHPSDDNT